MTNEEIENFRDDLMSLFDKYKEALGSVQYDWSTPEEAILIGISECFRLEKETQTQPEVINALESSIDSLKEAALDYYVSTK